MATNSQNISLGFDGDELGELVSISVDGFSSDVIEVTPRTSLGRNKLFRPGDLDLGTVTVTLLSGTYLSVDRVGVIGQFIIAQGANVLVDSGPAMLQSLAWRATVGELQQYVAVFKLGATT